MQGINQVLNLKINPFKPIDFCSLKEDEFLKDGIIYCKKCNTKRISISPDNTSRVRCLCKCQLEEYNKEKQKAIELERQKEINYLRDLSLIGERYKNVNFNNTKTGHNSSFTAAFIRCKKYCQVADTVLNDGLGMYIYGDKGTGKTHLTACIANDMINQRKQVLITSFSEISKTLRDNFASKNLSETAYIVKLANIDLLIIDDLGTERVKTNGGDLWLQEKIYDIVNRRYNNKKSTIFTSNYNPTQLIQERGFMDKTVDRIASMSNALMKIEGKSFRFQERMEQKLPF